jgi:HlyD family secretion protein
MLRRFAGLLKLLPVLVVVALLVRHRMFSPVEARAHVIDRGLVRREAFGRATIESRREVQLGFDLVGRISDVLVDEGDRVKLGQVVAHLSPEQLAADAQAATTGVGLAQAGIARLDADEKRAEAALAFAQSEVERTRKLAASGAVTARDLDLAEQQLKLATADLARVRAARIEGSKQIAVAAGAAGSKQATITRAALVSPFDGLVVRRFRDPGDTVTVGTTVLRIVSTDRLWARAAIDETLLSQLHEGQTAALTLYGESAGALGTVDRIGREVDRQTHEVLVDVLLPSPPPRVAIGQRTDVWIALAQREDALRVPLEFVQREGGATFCLVDRGGRVARAPIKLGMLGTAFVEVLEGVGAGDTVLAPTSAKSPLPIGRRWRSAS